jgi:hypothetical protein
MTVTQRVRQQRLHQQRVIIRGLRGVRLMAELVIALWCVRAGLVVIFG